MSSNEQPIIIKKVKKGGHGHHGGAWKVAYADFVTAMMAFFLLLWLLNVTTEEQKQGIGEYFAPTAASRSTSGSGSILGGNSLQVDGAQNSNTGVPSVTMSVTPPPKESEADKKDETFVDRMAEQEQRAFEQARAQLLEAIDENPELGSLAKHLIVDMTPEGLRIQIVDQDGESMFEKGSAVMRPKIKRLLGQVAKSIRPLSNRLSISGHTDASRFAAPNYSNWELSSDRANASRRALLASGLEPERVADVTGKADTEPMIPDDPSNPANRRISIVLLREAPVLPPNYR